MEFITASGYLSARKIRARFASLVAQAAEKSAFRDVLRVIPGPNSESCCEVRVRVRERYTVLLVPGFRVSGVWPRGALGAQFPGTVSELPITVNSIIGCDWLDSNDRSTELWRI